MPNLINPQFLSDTAAPDRRLQLDDRNHLWSRLGSSGSGGGGDCLRLEEAEEQGADRHHEQTYRGGGGQGSFAGGK